MFLHSDSKYGDPISIITIEISIIYCYNDGDKFKMKEIPVRSFDYITSPEKLLTPEIVQMVGSIHEHKGKQELFLEANTDELKTLLEVALIQSTGASNRIEGIFTSDKRLEELVSQKAEPRNRPEQEIAGYREVLATIHESYEYITPRPNIILQLHRDLYSYSKGATGGSYKNSDNVIAETNAEGHQETRFVPVPAFQTAEAMDELCTRFLEAWETDRIDKLVLVPMFILDFLCLHPFNDGNGRMSRLLTILLFYKAGYIVGKYVSMEMLIEKTKETYYEALQASSAGWHECKNSYEPFVKYYLGIMLKAYNEFESRVEHLKHRSLSKPERIKTVIDKKVGKITKKEIMEICPDISKVTVERTLTELVKSGYIAKVGAGPSTGYVRVDNQENNMI